MIQNLKSKFLLRRSQYKRLLTVVWCRRKCGSCAVLSGVMVPGTDQQGTELMQSLMIGQIVAGNVGKLGEIGAERRRRRGGTRGQNPKMGMPVQGVGVVGGMLLM